MKDWIGIAVITLALAICVGAGLADCYAPCSAYRASRIKDIPARCLKEYAPPTSAQ